MGKPWKQNTHISLDEPIQYKWSLQYYTLKEILTFFKLPIVVQCEDKSCSVLVDNFFFDLGQPLLLYTKRFTRKAEARCLQKLLSGNYEETKQNVVIPEHYDGWFKISQQMDFEKPTPHYSIQSLIHSGSEFFLCTEEFSAICIESKNAEDSTVERIVAAGEVLRKTGVHSINTMMLPPAQRNDDVNTKFLMCIDDNDDELLVPLNQAGVFYEVSDGKFDRKNCLIQIGYMIEEIEAFPVYLRHVLGEPPLLAHNYSPYLKLVKIIEEETLMASTLKRDGLFPLEIQSNSPIRFQIALNTGKILLSSEYVEAMELCKSVEETYVKDIKFAFTMSPPVAVNNAYSNPSFADDEQSELASSRSSQRTTASNGTNVFEIETGEDLVDIDANSEFSIDWNPWRTESNASNNLQLPISDNNGMLLNSFEGDVDQVVECSFVSGDLDTSHESGIHSQAMFIRLSENDRCFCEKHLQRREKILSKDLPKVSFRDNIDSTDPIDPILSRSHSLSRKSMQSSSSNIILPYRSHSILGAHSLDFHRENRDIARRNDILVGSCDKSEATGNEGSSPSGSILSFDSIPVWNMDQQKEYYVFNRSFAGDAKSVPTSSEDTITVLTTEKMTEINEMGLPEVIRTNSPSTSTSDNASEDTVRVGKESNPWRSSRSSLSAGSSENICLDGRQNISDIPGFGIETFYSESQDQPQDFVRTASLPMLSVRPRKQMSASTTRSSSWEGLAKTIKGGDVTCNHKSSFPGYTNMYGGFEDLHSISGVESDDVNDSNSQKEYGEKKREEFSASLSLACKKNVNVDTQTGSHNKLAAINVDGNFPYLMDNVSNHTHDDSLDSINKQVSAKERVQSVEELGKFNVLYESNPSTNDKNSSTESLQSNTSNSSVSRSGKIATTLCQRVRRKNEIKKMGIGKGV